MDLEQRRVNSFSCRWINGAWFFLWRLHQEGGWSWWQYSQQVLVKHLQCRRVAHSSYRIAISAVENPFLDERWSSSNRRPEQQQWWCHCCRVKWVLWIKIKVSCTGENFKNTTLQVSAYIGDICLQTKQSKSAFGRGWSLNFFFNFLALVFLKTTKKTGSCQTSSDILLVVFPPTCCAADISCSRPMQASSLASAHPLWLKKSLSKPERKTIHILLGNVFFVTGGGWPCLEMTPSCLICRHPPVAPHQQPGLGRWAHPDHHLARRQHQALVC